MKNINVFWVHLLAWGIIILWTLFLFHIDKQYQREVEEFYQTEEEEIVFLPPPPIESVICDSNCVPQIEENPS